MPGTSARLNNNRTQQKKWEQQTVTVPNNSDKLSLHQSQTSNQLSASSNVTAWAPRSHNRHARVPPCSYRLSWRQRGRRSIAEYPP